MLVAIVGGALEVLVLHSFEFILLCFGDALLQFLDFLGRVYFSDVNTRTSLIHGINSLVREEAVTDVAFGQCDTCLQCLVGVIHTVMLFIHLLDVVKDFECLLGRGRLNQHFLKAAFESAILLNALAILVKRGGSDALELAACQCRLEQVGCIHRAAGIAGAHNVVDLIDEHDDVLVSAHLVNDRFEAFLELSTVLGTGHDSSHVERDDALVEQGACHFSFHNAFGKPFDNRALTHTGLSDHHWVVFLAAAQNLCQALNFHLSAHHRVQAALGSFTGDVFSIFVNHRSGRIVTPTDISSLSCLAVGWIRAFAVASIITATWQLIAVIFVLVWEVGTRDGQAKVPTPVLLLVVVLVVYHYYSFYFLCK